MATYAAQAPVKALPTREEVREMLRHPAVACVAILGAVLVLLGFVGAVVFLAYNDKSTEALAVVVITPVLALLGAIFNKLHAVQQQTNGTTSRLLDAALPTPSSTDVTQ